MLRSLDALIGFTTLLLVLSLVVIVLTQIAANFLKLRSQHLRDGLLDVFLQLGWEFAGECARILARDVAHRKDAITREDLIETLLVLAQKTSSHPVYGELRKKIADCFRSADASGERETRNSGTFSRTSGFGRRGNSRDGYGTDSSGPPRQ